MTWLCLVRKLIPMQNLIIKYWTWVSISILALSAVWIWISAAPTGSTTNGFIPAPQEGFLAPDFELITLDGDLISLSDLGGKVVLVNFWASWCPPCRSEMPAMQKIFDRYGPDNFVILAVNNTRGDKLVDIENFVIEKNLSFPILLDHNGQVTNQYLVHSLPTSFFIDREGVIQEIVIGGMNEALLISRFEKLYAEGD